MRIKTLYLLLVLLPFLFFSCGKDHNEISETQFINSVLPEVEIDRVEIKNLEDALVYTNEQKTYKITLGSRNSAEEFVNRIRAKNEKVAIGYTTESSSPFWVSIMQFLPLIFPLLILIHLILLWIALRRIIKSHTDNIEKLVYTIISIFFPFFGPIIYLTTNKG